MPWQILRAIAVTAVGKVRKIWVNRGHEAPEILLYVGVLSKSGQANQRTQHPRVQGLVLQCLSLGRRLSHGHADDPVHGAGIAGGEGTNSNSDVRSVGKSMR
jgi:hypothetical protein